MNKKIRKAVIPAAPVRYLPFPKPTASRHGVVLTGRAGSKEIAKLEAI